MTNNKPAGASAPRPFTPAPVTRPAGLAGKVRLQAATPDAVLAVVPHMLGFYPSRSLVVLGLGEQNRVMVTFRYDLPSPPDSQLAEDIAEHASYVLDRERISSALLVGYGPADLVVPVVGTTAVRLVGSGVELHEVLRADSGRYWSMLCDDPACCPPGGRSYDPGSHPAAAALTEAGLAAQPDREALARTVQRPAGSAEVIARATGRALLRLSQLTELGEAEGDRDPQLRATRIGRREVQRAIRRYRAGETIDSIEHLAWLAVLAADLRVRDDAWARMDPAYHDHHCRLWTDVLRCAALDYVPAPAALLAFAAWQSGNGVLAAIAVDRALSADPGYSMARLLSDAIQAALPPSAARLPMTPAQVAASYAAASDVLPGEPETRSGPASRSSHQKRAASAGHRTGSAGKNGKAGRQPGRQAKPQAAAADRQRARGRAVSR
ncbi:MAG TPA: DUF4192 domain-containing protein [Streptosporangiaceae bacterium]|nr:DUF4192 domain-containing protein [Streptosporangiaceae bacterium]